MPSISAAFRFLRPSSPASVADPTRARVELDGSPTVFYAVGDVHGCLAKLRELEAKIFDDAARFSGDKLIIMLGDYVDRGPDSCGVLDHLCSPAPQGFKRICLAGNHDAAMLAFIDGRMQLENWLAIGGVNTLFSYGLDPQQIMERERSAKAALRTIRSSIPARHVRFLRELPVLAYTRTLAFVHAGLRPGIALPDQSDNDLMSIRLDPGAAPYDRIVIHGHTPVVSPVYSNRRICLDTGAYYSGILSALRIADRDVALIATR